MKFEDMKFRQTHKRFDFKNFGVVVPFNAEEEEEEEKYLYPGTKDYMTNNVSWSHGFTHFKDVHGNYLGFCGINYFEKHAKELKEE